MSHALAAIDHALRGDPGGLSYLEQTASIYVFNAATTQPQIYGWWNFLNDALNEVERFESTQTPPSTQPTHPTHPTQPTQPQPNLDSHVRLLATLTRRVARRPPSSDRRLVGTCISNASMSHMHMLASAEMSRTLLNNNDEMRERNMGRITAIVFDFSFHRRSNAGVNHSHHSAFSDPVAMEQFCGAVAANAVSTGPDAVRYLVSDWIVPSIQSMPPFAVVSILGQIAVEAMGKGCPAGTRDVIQSLVPSVFKSALGLILLESLRDSEQGGDSMVEHSDGAGSAGANTNQRVAALAFIALNSWCKEADIGMVQLRHIFHNTQINILECIADALYSDAEIIIDSVADCLETLLQRDSKDATVALGVSIAESFMKSSSGANNGLNQILMAQQITRGNEAARISALSELVTAIGLQRFRFSERQSLGDTAVCRCLARTAGLILQESQDLVRNEALKGSMNGMFDLLFKAVAHPSVYVCGIAVEALATVVSSSRELSVRLLPLLQGKAIVPLHFLNGHENMTSETLDDYQNFRDRVLTDALIACYNGCGEFYLESCGSAIEEFCLANPSPHLPYQLEAALFCMVAVSENVKKTLQNSNSMMNSSLSGNNTTLDTKLIGAQLEKIISALSKNNFSITSKPLAMAKMCRFINVYATSFPSCQSKSTFESASELALNSFNLSLSSYNANGSSEENDIDSMTPFSEACVALKSLICSSPELFSAPSALSALESAWKMPYSSKQIDIKDREMLCSGLCFLIASLPPEQWSSSLEGMAQPILTCLDATTREADKAAASGMLDNPSLSGSGNSLMYKISSEIRLLASIVHFFGQTNGYKNGTKPSHRNALVGLLQKSWPCLTQIGNKYSYIDCVAESLGRLLRYSLSLCKSEEDLPLFLELTTISKASLSLITTKRKSSSLASMLSFVQKTIEIHGHRVDHSKEETNPNNSFRNIIVELMLMSYEAVRSCSSPGVQNGKSIAPQDNVYIPDVLTPMFQTLSSCAKKCPNLLLTLAGEGQPIGDIVRSSVEATPEMIRAHEVDVTISTIEFLKSLVVSIESLSKNQSESPLSPEILSVMNNLSHFIRGNVLSSTVSAMCGVSLQEVLDPMADLMQTIMIRSSWKELEETLGASLSSDKFKLGDDAKYVVLNMFKKCTESGYSSGNFGSMVVDIWRMHQTDDTGSIAGGELVLKFICKYGVNSSGHNK